MPRPPLRRLPIPGLLAALLAGPPAGCSIYRAPSVALGGATVSQRTDEAMQLQIELTLSNPNKDPLELREATYTFSVGGKPVYAGRRSAEATLSALGTKRVDIPVVVPFDRLAWPGPPAQFAWSISGALVYVTPGALTEILLDTGVRTPTVSFRGKGEATVPVEDDAGGEPKDGDEGTKGRTDEGN